MDKDLIITKTVAFVKSYMSDKEAGHNWWHIERVWKNAKYIYSKEKAGDIFLIELAALLHDIGDDKIDPETDGPELVGAFLSDLGLSDEIISSIREIMAKISFRDNLGQTYKRSAELDIVQDADRLDAIGAIGIARAFAYGGSKGNEIYNPEKSARKYKSKEEYHISDSSTINHFSEKLLLLKDKMNTETGRHIAEERHLYMEEFLEKFHQEWSIGKYEI